MKQALPIGNGRLGGMVFGGVEKERIQFNEDSLWIGDERDTGAYQAFGDLFIEMPHTGATEYRRELDIGRAVHTVTYASGGVRYKREYFASDPAGVMVFRFTSDKQGAHTGAVTLTDMHKGKVTARDNGLLVSGTLAGYKYRRSGGPAYGICLSYEAQIVVLNEGGTVSAGDGKIGACCTNPILRSRGAPIAGSRRLHISA